MNHLSSIRTFLSDDSGAITVDWTVLSAAAVGMALATVAVMNDGIDAVGMRMDDELRSRQLSDNFVVFQANHFEPILELGLINEADAETLYTLASELMNYDLSSSLTEGITAMEEGTITGEELAGLVAQASVAYQRNIIDDSVLDYYFGLDGSDPYYMQLGQTTQVATN